MKKIIIFLICFAIIGLLLAAWSQMKAEEYDETIARVDKIIEEAER